MIGLLCERLAFVQSFVRTNDRQEVKGHVAKGNEIRCPVEGGLVLGGQLGAMPCLGGGSPLGRNAPFGRGHPRRADLQHCLDPSTAGWIPRDEVLGHQLRHQRLFDPGRGRSPVSLWFLFL